MDQELPIIKTKKIKKVLILCLLFLFSASVNGQKLIFSTITVNLPANATAIQGSEIAARTASVSKTNSEIDPKTKNLYLINGRVVGLWNNGSAPGEEHPLERTKSEMTSVLVKYGKATIYSANIVTIKHIRFVVINYELGGNYYIRFYSEDVKNTSLSGIIQYKEHDSEKAMETLNTLLGGVTIN